MPEFLVGICYHEPESFDLWRRGLIEDCESSTGLWVIADSSEQAIAWGRRVGEALHLFKDPIAFSPGHDPMMPRIPAWIGVLVLVSVVAASSALLLAGMDSARNAAEAESFAVLQGAQSLPELRVGIGPLGVLLELRGGDWVAIRYRDSHAAPGWSSAVARDSGGAWFASREHFCGRFQIHRQLRERGEVGLAELRAIEESFSLEEARHRLVGLGFHPLQCAE
jgi:hypothetical protein